MLSGCLADAKPTLSQNSIEENRIEENRIDYIDNFVAIYSRECPELPQIRTITEKRKKAICKFLKTYQITDWEEVCKTASSSSFLMGKTGNKWRASFDFLINVDNAVKVLEGRYADIAGRETKGATFSDLLREGYGNDEEGNIADVRDNTNIVSSILSEYSIE